MIPNTVNHKPTGPWRQLIDRLLPQPCRFCGAAAAGIACCEACRADLPWLNDACRRCALPMGIPGHTHCGRCLSDPPAFAASVAAFAYAWPLDTLIKALKYHGRLADAALLGTLFSNRLADGRADRPQALVPIPMHDRRLRQRGFNQAREIAAILGRCLDIPLRPELLRRPRATDPQAGLSATARRRNLQGAFHCPGNGRLQHVALVDDVMTTGATARAAAACLVRAGVERVDVWAVARAG